MRYLIAFFVTLGLLFLVLFLLFHSGGTPKIVTTKTLDSYAATNTEAILTIDGPINANQDHQQVRISVGRDNVAFEQINGYDGSAVRMQNYSNTQNAYENFLLALAHAGFTRGDNNPNSRDERGFCPLGDRYVFQLRQDNQDIERYWATSCGKPKTYLGALSLTLTLFEKQVSNYGDLTQKLNL